MDFFRSVIPPFCVSSNIKAVHALALEYLVAFYPIFLIIITYVCIKLHDNNFRPVVLLWKPFHRYFVHFRRRWDSKASIINAFTTFLLLSFSKILFVCFTLLYTLDIRYNCTKHEKCVLYYDPMLGCHAQEYFLFATIAGCVLAVFIVCPTCSSSHFVLHKTVQEMCLLLWISEVACSAHVCGIISGTVQRWNQWYS